MKSGDGGVHDDVCGAHYEAAAIGHGVTGIDSQIQENLLDLARVSEDRREFGFRSEAKLNMFADKARDHLVHFGDGAVEVDDTGLEDLHAAEREKLASHRDGAVGSLLDLLDVFALGWFPTAIEKQVAIAANHRKEIIEIVRDSAGEPPDCLHFLSLHQLFFQMLSLSYVLKHRDVLHD